MSVTDIRSPNLSRGLKIDKPAVRSEAGIVVAHNRLAAHIGTEVLKKGGNAVDAAVAVSFAVGVLEPWMSGVGGVGAMLVRTADGAITAIDAGARSPAGLDPADFPLVEGKDGDLFGWPSVLEDRNVIGGKSICIPGLVKGLGLAHARFGRLPWAELVLPAAAIAEEGPVVDFHTTLWIAQDMARLRRNEACAAWFLPDGLPPAAPMAVAARVKRLPNRKLAETLRTIAAEGPDALYNGPLAEALAADIQAVGGYMTADDLAGFAAVEAPAGSEPYRGHVLHIVPELNGGVTVALAMRHMNKDHAPAGPIPDASDFLAYCKAMEKAWEHRFANLGDGAERTLPSCTTHFSVVDRDGMTVSLTQTLLSLFGSGVVSPATGILLNNGVNWFDPRPGRINSIGPARKALANYSPVMMTGPDDDVIAIGGSGGRKILPAVYMALTQMVDFGYELDAAIAAPRFDMSAPPQVVVDARLGRSVIETLAAHYPVVVTERIEHPNHFTTLGAVRRRGRMNEGAAEPFHAWTDAVAEGESLFLDAEEI